MPLILFLCRRAGQALSDSCEAQVRLHRKAGCLLILQNWPFLAVFERAAFWFQSGALLLWNSAFSFLAFPCFLVPKRCTLLL